VLSARPTAGFLFLSASSVANSVVAGQGLSSLTSFSDLRPPSQEPAWLSLSSWPPPCARLACGVAVAVWGAPPPACRHLLRGRQGGGSHQESWSSHGISSLRLFLTFVRSQCCVILAEKKNLLLLFIDLRWWECVFLQVLKADSVLSYRIKRLEGSLFNLLSHGGFPTTPTRCSVKCL
jgi:hypothetical protein